MTKTRAKIIAISNHKGGVGKTTTAITLGHGLAYKGYEVVIVDLDTQGHVATFLGLERAPGLYRLIVAEMHPVQLIIPTNRPRLCILPGDINTARAKNVLAAMEFKEDRLREALDPLLNGSGPDFIILDTPPSKDVLHDAAMAAADLILVPCATTFASVEGLAQLTQTIARFQERRYSVRLAGVIPTFYDDRLLESRDSLADLKRLFGESLYPIVRRATVLEQCAGAGETIFEYAPRSRAASEYAAVVGRFLQDAA